MNFFADGIKQAWELIFRLDPEVMQTVWISLRVSLTATAGAVIVGVPIGFMVGTGEFRGQRICITILNTLQALPTVVIGLLLYGLFSRQGPMGDWGLLFTTRAMMAGQCILATPIIAALTTSAVKSVDPRARETAVTLGAGRVQVSITVLREARFALVAAVIAGFGRVITEVGCAMMIGGNIRGLTRNMTTAIALETSKGAFGYALALGLILLTVAFSINILFQHLQQRRG